MLGLAGGIIGTLGAYGAAWYTINSQRKTDRKRQRGDIAENLLDDLIAMRRKLLLKDDVEAQELHDTVLDAMKDMSKIFATAFRLGDKQVVNEVENIQQVLAGPDRDSGTRDGWWQWKEEILERITTAEASVIIYPAASSRSI